MKLTNRFATILSIQLIDPGVRVLQTYNFLTMRSDKDDYGNVVITVSNSTVTPVTNHYSHLNAAWNVRCLTHKYCSIGIVLGLYRGT